MREELLERAQALVPVLKERANECEKLRRIPEATIADLKSTRLVDVCKPAQYGGYELGWDVFCEIVMELAQGCGSTAWVYSVYAEHANRMGNYPLEIQAEVWGTDPNTFISSGNSGQAELEPVDGGFRLSGRFNYSSGCDHAGWHITGAKVKDTKERRQIAFPASDRELDDNWFVVGLAGTGSKDYLLNDVFIPEYRTYIIPQPGVRAKDNVIFRLPQWSVNPFDLAAVSVGVAQGGLDQFVESLKTRMSRFGAKIAEFQSLQLRIAESAAELDMARRIILDDLRESQDYLQDNKKLPRDMMTRNKRDMAYAPVLATRAIDRIFYAAGAGGLLLSGDLQRCFRDVHAGAAQLALNWDVNGTTYGQVALGLDPGMVRW
ncbi:MAG: hypothetical protein HN884_12630 [Rhodospirillaceae bacterium]|jgi:alkylation response protein AidB-like acyl-CoA dehydrogenase|nr:hypothetical protein [Rhodospirillaceae bacterium]